MGRRGEDDLTVDERRGSQPIEKAPQPGVDTDPVPRTDEAEIALPSRFETVEVIGEGGMGRVLRVVDKSLSREVAVKLMHPQHINDPHARQRFLREARAAGALRHPNIVTVHDVAPGGEYLVMEYVEGESLAARIRREGKLPVAEVRRISDALLAALTVAHHEGIIHRDIKPANILVDNTGAVKLADFGIASFGDSELTSTGQSIGTPAYMAPEQLRGRRVDQRADIYGVGVTLFEAATGKRLNDDRGRLANPRRTVLEATDDAVLAAAIHRAVEEKEADRFPDVASFSQAFARRASGRRWRFAVAAGAMLALAVVVTAIVGLYGSRHRAAPPGGVTIAVLPFADHIGDARLDFASSGLPHILGAQLGQTPRLHTIGYYRVSAQLVDSKAPLDAWIGAARKLGANHVVYGELDPAGTKVRVSIIVQQIDGKVIDRIVREEALDRVPDAVQNAASSVARAALGAASEIKPSSSHDFEIEREHQLGVAAFEAQDFDTARTHLSAAVARDSSLGEAYYLLAILDWWGTESPIEHIERALASPLPPIDHEFVVGLRMLVEHDYPRVVAFFRDLSDRAPEHREVQYGYFEALFHGGAPSESMQVYRHLRKLAPHFYVGAEHAMVYYLTRGDSDGIRWTLAHWKPRPEERTMWNARALVSERKYAQAVALVEQAAEESGANYWVGRTLVEVYAATGQLALARKATTRLAQIDPNYRSLANYAFAVASGERDTASMRTAASLAIALAVPGIKDYLVKQDLIALDLASGKAAVIQQDLPSPLTGTNANLDATAVLVAGAVNDHELVETARSSHFAHVAAFADALSAESRKDFRAAAVAWRRSLDLNGEGRFQIYAWHALARDLVELGDHAGVIAACDEVINPRYFTWAWGGAVGTCLQWSAEASASLGRADDANKRWKLLLALRSAAPPGDDLVEAAHKALAK
jgi:tetratricopeptide (TPR) repeat protein/predicted nucleic acid-binding protein